MRIVLTAFENLALGILHWRYILCLILLVLPLYYGSDCGYLTNCIEINLRSSLHCHCIKLYTHCLVTPRGTFLQTPYRSNFGRKKPKKYVRVCLHMYVYLSGERSC